jgi:hypothetical protein
MGAEIVAEGDEDVDIFPRHDDELAGETVVTAVLG